MNLWTAVPEKTLESPLDCKEIKPVIPKGNQSWIFIGRTDAEAEAPILWPPDTKNWLLGKDPDVGKDWRQKDKGNGSVMPDVRIPEREERRLPRQCNSQKGKFIAGSSQGSCCIQRSGAGSESPESEPLYKFIGWA